ncbi:alpha/beta fold hydrolase [Microbacterium xanthum]|uniref:alpha/beta fold hydrolase n=1 Tax=Microbacterium xanthum TaxID=3079794 RepID=UPI002AD29015|nr:alpha/beta hydrolase [Microbacterium sp. KSW-48]MDZ8171139.1 alpha/beta hydrolase [Microbacterium sp. KSW-48]
MERVSDPADEFSFLAAQAADAGLDGPLPHAERVSMQLADGRTLSGVAYGWEDAAPGPVVTFLHGAGLNAHTWDTVVLGTGAPALALDLPGHGDSSWRDDAAYVARVLAPDVASALERWTDRPQVVVGHSLGGLTAAALAASRPDLIEELVIVDITPGVDPDDGPSELRAFFAGPTDWASRDELVDRALSFGLGGGSREKVARGVFFNSRVRDDGRVEWKHHFARLAADAAADPSSASDARRRQDAVGALLGANGWEDLAEVRAPITLVTGTRGFVTDTDAAHFRERLPAAALVSIPSGHNVQEEAPLELAALVRDHLRQ